MLIPVVAAASGEYGGVAGELIVVVGSGSELRNCRGDGFDDEEAFKKRFDLNSFNSC